MATPDRDSKIVLERINTVRRRAINASQRAPAEMDWGRYHCPLCHQLLQVIASRSDPDIPPPAVVVDAVYETIYACPGDHLLWLHEEGGYEGINRWLGPVPAKEEELEPLVDSPPDTP